MKTLNITFTDEEFKKLCKAKSRNLGVYSWHGFVLTLAKGCSVKKKSPKYINMRTDTRK